MKKSGVEKVMQHRMNWMKDWVIGRKYDIGDKRRDFLYIYFHTLRALYDEEMVKKMIGNFNNKFDKPLPETTVESVIQKASEKGVLWFKNSKIIKRLGITKEEVKALGIERRKQEQAERDSRKFRNFVEEQEIIQRYINGESTKSIVESGTSFSSSTINNLIKDLAKERKAKRNAKIIALKEQNKTNKEIAALCNCDVKTVARVLREKIFFLHNKDGLKESSELQHKYKEAGCQVLLSLYKEETYTSTEDSFEHALQQLQNTKENVLLIGAAGTAKSTLMNRYIESLSKKEKKKTVIVAPTGFAAQHINGTTIHYAFKLGIGVLEPNEIESVPKELHKMKRIIIDEISMVRVDLFEQVIRTIRFIEQKYNRRIQIILCGDFGQISPVVSKKDQKILKQHWPNAKDFYPYESQLWGELNLKRIMLTHVFRQTDKVFREHLDAIKYGDLNSLDWFNKNCLNKHYSPNAICICAKNKDVDAYNQMQLDRHITKKSFTYVAIENGVNEADELPCPREITICEDARVMFICNDKEYKNGNLGSVLFVNEDVITVAVDGGDIIGVKRKKFHLDSGGTYEQFPLVLGFAITANKCQGCSFDEIIVMPGFFAPSQLYVALSRCRKLEGLCIMKPLTERDLVVNLQALGYTV